MQYKRTEIHSYERVEEEEEKTHIHCESILIKIPFYKIKTKQMWIINEKLRDKYAKRKRKQQKWLEIITTKQIIWNVKEMTRRNERE